MIRRILWRATTALIVLAMAVPLVQAAPTRGIAVDEPAVMAPKAGPPEPEGAGESKWKLVSSGTTAVETTEPALYIIQLEDAPVASYRGGIEGLEATNPGAQGEVQLDASSPESIAYASYLEQQQEKFIDAMERSVERPVEVRYQYKYAYNGVAAKLTAMEAAKVAELPDVVHVERDTMLQPTTDVGPAWIGAEGIWEGTATGGLPGTKGEGIVAGILDTGINMDHPSFAATGDDGYTHVNPFGEGTYVGLCATEPETFVCNSKLIGAWDFVDAEGGEEDGAEDHDGHGSHTASTVAGNVVYSPTIEAETITVTAAKISGVAPHANIIAYDVCDADGCPNSATMAAKDQAIIDGVDVINYSIGGGATNPWTDAGAVSWLNVRDAGIFAATSAGNDGPDAATMGSPGTAPWILTVGATTHNRWFSNALIDMEGGGAPPDDIVGKSVTSGYGPAEIVYAGWYASPNYPDGNPGCMEPFPAGTFDGEIVVCDRGEIARVDKGTNVLAGGAGGLVLANAEADAMQINADAHVLPAVHITYQDGVTLKAWLTDTEVQMATIAGTTMDVDDDYGDIMAAFSSRGPNPAQTQVAGIIKPDLTAPGVDVLAASRNGIEFESMGGTSMSSPHVVGAAALIRAVHPDWTPAEVQSAMMMTAYNEDILKEDEMTPADPFDTGSGRVDLSKAAMAGLVLDETTENFENADPELGGDPLTLNLASLGNSLCLQQCSWTRTVENVLETEATYTAIIDAPAGMTVTVDPPVFTVPALGSQVITVEADVSALPSDEWVFAEVGLETDAMHPAFSASWEESFEGTYPPTDWSTYAIGDETDPGWIPTDVAAYSGDYAAGHFDDDLPTPADSWLVTPQFTPTDETQLAFWQLTYWDSYYGYHGIWVSDGSGDPNDGDFVELAELDDGTGGSWGRVVQELGGYAGTPIYVAFRYIGDYNDWWLVDDVAAREVDDSAFPVSDLHMPMAVVPSRGVLPNLIEVETRRNAGSQLIEDLQSLEITDLTLDYFGFTEASLELESLYGDPTNDTPYDFGTVPTGTFTINTTVGVGAQRLVAEITESAAPDIDLFVGRDLDGDGPEESEEVCSSTTPSWNEYCNVSNPEPGDWWILVQNWQSSGAGMRDDVTLAWAVVPGADSGNMTATGPEAVPEKEAFDLRLFWDEPDMEAGDHWYGAISIGTDSEHPGNIGTIPVNLLRRQDDVTKTVTPSEAQPGDTVTYKISIQPDITGQELTYYIADTMPDGVTYVPGSATAGSGTLSVVDNRLTWSGQVIPPREYLVSTSLDDPLCTMPLANSGAYVDLEAFGFGADAGIEGDGVAYGVGWPGGPFAFYGDPTGNTLYFTDDGFVSLDLDSVLAGPFANASIPTADLPNALMAMLWNDMEIVYEAGTGENNRGATTGIYLTTGGVPSAKLLEFDDIQKVGDPSSQIDFEMVIAEAVDDAMGEYEVVFAYDNLTGAFESLSTGTIGVEDYDGSMGTQYAYNDANLQTLEDGMAICFDYQIPPKPVEITYQATVDDDASGTLVNEVWHNTNNPGSRPEMVSAEVVVPNAYLQVAHLAPFAEDASVTVKLNGTDALTDFAYGDSTGYIELPAREYLVEVVPTGTTTVAISATVDLEQDSYYTAIAVGDGVNQDLALIALGDDLTPPASGTFHLRVGHLAPFASGDATADVRLQDGTPILEGVNFSDVTGFIPLPAGEYDLKITTPGGDTTLIDPLPVTLTEGQILSAFATGDGANQDLGVFALPAGETGGFLPLFEPYRIFMPLVASNYTPPAMELTILHTNDTHAHLEPFQPWGEPVQGGVARRYTAIQQVKAEGGNVILVDAGDPFQGTLFFNVWQGEEEAYFMNALGYQAMAVGNHEFDSGPATLADFIGLADFPVLSANIDASAEPTLAGLIEDYTILDVGGEQVGVFGLTTEETEILSSPGPNVVFEDNITAAQATVDTLEGMGINKIVALTHLGYGPDQVLAAAVDGIDVIVGGHSHTLLGSMEGAAGPYPTVIDSPAGDPVLIVTAQDWGRYLGRLDVDFNADGEVVSYSGEPIFMDESIAEDPTIAADVATFAEPIEDLKNTVIGESEVLLEGTRELVRSQETNLGNLICDAMLWATASEDTQICVQNGGGIRASIPPGEVTMGQVLEVLPFGNQIATFGLTGADVWAALENGVSQWESGAGRFPQVGGLKYVFDSSLPAGSRIVSVDVKQADGTYEPLDLEEVYKLTSNNFMRTGGDGYSMFADNAIDPYDAGAVLADAVAEYITAYSPVSPTVEGRITNLAVSP